MINITGKDLTGFSKKIKSQIKAKGNISIKLLEVKY